MLMSTQVEPKNEEKSSIKVEEGKRSTVARSLEGVLRLKGKLSADRIKNQFRKMTKYNSAIVNYLKNIAKQIKTDLLTPSKCSLAKVTQTSESNQLADQAPKTEENTKILNAEVLPDEKVITGGVMQSMLINTVVDNDVESDEENLNCGVRYLYGQLLYSVGEQISKRVQIPCKIQQSRKIKNKKQRQNGNKQNENSQNQYFTAVSNRKQQNEQQCHTEFIGQNRFNIFGVSN